MAQRSAFEFAPRANPGDYPPSRYGLSNASTASFTRRAILNVSAFWGHCTTNSRKAASGGFIEHAPVFVRGISNPSEDVLRFFEAFSRHHEHVDRVSDIAQGSADLHALFASVPRRRFDDEQINVAVTRHRAACRRTEEDDP